MAGFPQAGIFKTIFSALFPAHSLSLQTFSEEFIKHSASARLQENFVCRSELRRETNSDKLKEKDGALL